MAKIPTRWGSVFQFGNGYEFIRVLEMQGGFYSFYVYLVFAVQVRIDPRQVRFRNFVN